MNAQTPPAPEEIDRLVGEWRLRRRRIDAFAGDPGIDDRFLTDFKVAYHHLKCGSPVDPPQFLPPLHAMAKGCQTVRQALQNLTELHAHRDHSTEETRRCYPSDARALVRECCDLLDLIRDSQADLVPHVETDARRRMEQGFDRFGQQIQEMVAALEEGADLAEQLEALLSGVPVTHDRADYRSESPCDAPRGKVGILTGLKPGYKQTEIGVMPDDWDVPVFGALYSAPSRNGIYKRSEFQGRGTKIVNMGEMFGYEFISAQEMSRVELSARELSASGLQDGDLLFGRRSVVPAGAGKCSLVISPPEPLTFESSIIRVRPNRDATCPLFLYYFFASPSGKSVISTIVAGTNVKGIRATELRELSVPRPTLAEQEAIAEALGDADSLIDALEQLIAKKRLLKQGAMQDLLTGKKRLPGFEGEWEVKTFGEIFEFLPTATNSRSDLGPEGDAYYIHYGDIHTRFHNHLYFSTASPPRIDRVKCLRAALLRNGDWVMADASEDYDGVGKTIEIQGLDAATDAVSGLHTFLLREKRPTFASGFKGHIGSLKSLHEQYLRVATGMKVYGVSKTALRELELPVPSIPEQTAIAAILSDMDAEIAALEAKLTKARQIKSGMMQELLTGKTRLV